VSPAERVVGAAQAMLDRGLTVGMLGNVSVRDGDTVWITPSRCPARHLTDDRIVSVSIDDEQADRRASSELPLHLAIYRRFPDVAAIFHTHSPWAAAWSYLGRPLAPPSAELAYYGFAGFQCLSWSPGADAGPVCEALAVAPAVLLACHGVVCVAHDAAQAAEWAALVEHQAQLAWLLSRRDSCRCPGEDLATAT
jgi:L-fuculose-phosphate aldolase